MSVCSGHDDRARDATAVHQKVALASIFSPGPSGSARQLPEPAALSSWLVDTLPALRVTFKVATLHEPWLPQGFDNAGWLPFEEALL